MKKKSYAEEVSGLLRSITEGNFKHKDFQSVCFAEIAVMLAVIADTLEGRKPDEDK